MKTSHFAFALRCALLALCMAVAASLHAVPQRALVSLSTTANAGGAGPAAVASSFTIEGSAAKEVLVRALGPALLAAPYNLTGTIGDPALVLFDRFGLVVAENDNWGTAALSPQLTAAAVAVGAVALADGSRDAALRVTLNPGTYTARVDGVAGAMGTALLEIYDADTGSLIPRLANLSVNTRIANSGNTSTVGFTIAPGADQTLLIRGIGPALVGAGVNGTLPNPSINVLNSSAVSVASNDNWGNATSNPTVGTAGQTAGLRPLADDGNDAALLVTLSPGSYTVELTGVGGTTGLASVEIAVIDADRDATFAPALLGPVLTTAAPQGGGISLSALAIGRPTPAYQWKKNGVDIGGATGAGYFLGNVTASDAANYSVSITNSAGSVTTVPTAATIWSAVNPTTHTGSFLSVAYSGTGYAAVGDFGIYTSPDGVTWTRRTTYSTQLRSIAFGGGKFVAVGDGGVARVSLDNGATWSADAFPFSNRLYSVLFDGTRFVAVGESSRVQHSIDGVAWTAGDLGTVGKTLNGVAYKSGGNYVTVASDGSIFSAADVVAGPWTAADSGTVNQLNGVAFVNDRFIAVGNSGVIRSSTTGSGSWTTVTNSSSNNLYNVAFGGATYAAVGENTLLTSPDAATWTSGSFAPTSNAGAKSVIYAGSQFLVVGFPGTILTSATGAINSWVFRTNATTLNYNDAVYANGRYVAVGSSGGILTSPDGTTLTSLAPVLPSLSNTILRRVIHAAGLYVAVGDTGTILTSVDGALWFNRSFGTTNYTALTYGGGKFVAAGPAGAYATSVDGNTWTAGSGTIGSANVNGLAYGGSSPVFVAVNATGGIYTSPDAVAWTARTSNTINQLNNVRFAGGQFIALGASSTVLTSLDGLAWTNRGLGASGVNLIDVAHGGGLNIAVHNSNSLGLNGNVFISVDGVTWTSVSLGSNTSTPVNFFAQAGITYGNGSFFVASNNGIVARTLANTGLPLITSQPANQTIGAGQNATLTVGTNGVPGTTYQWFRGPSGDTTTLLVGEVAASLVTNVSARYWVRVSGAGPAVNSATANVVGPTPTITTQPSGTSIVVGQGGSLSVTASTTGAGPLAYQWRKFGTPIPGANSPAFPLTVVALADAGYYDVVVSDGLASVTSRGVRVDIVPPLANYPTVLRPRASVPRIEAFGANATAFAVDAADSNRIYVVGEFTRVNGESRLGIARFNADGSYDNTWVPAAVTGGGAIRAILVESDGIIIAGDFNSVGGVTRGRIAKLNKSTGALDATFPSAAGANGVIYALARQTMADSSIRYLAGGSFSQFDGTNVNRLARLNANGTRDTTFTITANGGTGFGGDVRAIAVDGTGAAAKIYAGGLFTSHHNISSNRSRLVRLDHNGAYDATFDVGSGFNNDVRTIALEGTGAGVKVYVGGLFTTINGVSSNRNRIARLDANGAYDSTFAVGSGFGGDVLSLALDSTGNVYVGGNFTSFNGTTTNVNRLIRLTSAGARDTGFNNNLSGANSTINTILLRESDNQILLGGFFTTWNNTGRDGVARVALDATGTLDTAPAAAFRRPGQVLAIEPAPNGKWYIGGFFNYIDDVARTNLARLNADGTFDASFSTVGTGFNNTVTSLAVQGDGRIVVGGNFGQFNGTTRQDLARLFPDGTLDPSLNPGGGTGFTGGQISALQLQPDGKIVVGGQFNSFAGGTLNRIGRVHPDGTSDTAFNTAVGTGFNNTVFSLALQSDGSIVAGGQFTTLAGATANLIARLTPAGAPDTAFTTAGGVGFSTNNSVSALATRLNDKIVTGGSFSTYNTVSRNRVAVLNADGSLDTGFAPSSGAGSNLTTVALQSDDKVLLGGFFTAVNGVSRSVFARVTSTGATDTSLRVPTAIVPFNNINVLRFMPDGNVIVGATRIDFTEFAGRGSVVVLEAAPVPVIDTQPTDQFSSLGGSATFSVTATGEALQYQWLKNGIPIAGATGATLPLTAITLADAGSYAVVVSNLYGTVTSNTVTLSGSAPLPNITAHPVGTSGSAGGPAALTVTASGTGPLGYQWRKFGVPIAGANSATLNFPSLGLDAAGLYDVLVNDGLTVRASSSAQLSVGPSVYPNALRPKASFEPRVELVGIVQKFAPLADGRFYASGSFTSIDGTPVPGIARFLQDGTLDSSWTPPHISGVVQHIAPQADGKVVIGGSFVYINGVNQFRLARLNANGSLDAAFAVNVGSGVAGGGVSSIAIQPGDQKILVAGAFTSVNAYAANRIIRLNTDGTPDTSFAIGEGFDSTVNALVVQPDGKIVVVGGFTEFNYSQATRIARLTSTGALDNSFVTGSGFEFGPSALALQADNKIVVVGSFINYNGYNTANGIVRLDANGAREAGFPAGSGFSGLNSTTGPLSVAIQANGAIVVGGNFTGYNGTTRARLVRISGTDGAIDSALDTTLGTAGLNSTARHVAIQGVTNQILVGGPITLVNATVRSGLVRFNADGTLDPLNRLILEPGQVYAIQPVANGKFVIGGFFSHVGGTPINSLARVDATGALDATFNVGTGATTPGAFAGVRAIAQQGDGRLVIGGTFTAYNGTTTTRIARISADGALDTAFVTATGTGVAGGSAQVNAIALQPDGRIVFGGSFTSLNGVSGGRIARLLPTGAPDTAFSTANGTAFNTNTGQINTLVVQPDGRILAGGTFATFNGSPTSSIARLLAEGGLDSSFVVGSGFSLASGQTGSANVVALALQPDGRILAGGFFGQYNGSLAGGIVRLMPEGGVDYSFAIGAGLEGGAVQAMQLQPDGRVVLAGNFSRISGQRRGGLARFSSSGAIDLSFGAPFQQGIPASAINVLASVSDGSLLVGSNTRQDFIGRTVSGLMLLENGPAPALLTLPYGGAFNAGYYNATSPYILSVSAAGTGSLTYQWKRNNVALVDNVADVTGTKTNVLTFNNPQAVDAGEYTVTVTDATGSITTPPVTINIIASAPMFTGEITPGLGPVVQAGTAGFLSVPATGSGPITATWKKDGVPFASGYANSGAFYLPTSPAKVGDAGLYQLVLNNALGNAASAPTRVWVTEESGWTAHNPLPSPQGLLSLYVANGQFFAGGVRGARFSSPDGIVWNQLPNLSQNNLFGHLEGNGRRLLIGSLGFIGISIDGNNWRTASLPTVEGVQGSAFGSGLFVVCTSFSGSSSSRGKVFTSPDGENWTERYNSTSQSLLSLAYGNGAFALLTADGILRSPDGITWTIAPGTPSSGTVLRYLNGEFHLLTDDGKHHVSADAFTWALRSYGSTGASDITHANGQYLLTGANGMLMTSPDAINWTRRTTNVNQTLRSAAHTNGTWVVLSNATFPATILTSADNGVTWINRTTSVTYAHLRNIATDGTTSMIAVADGGLILRTTNGTAWSIVPSGVTDHLEGAAYGAGRYAVSGANGRILTSDDGGATWTPRVSGTSSFIGDLSYINGMFFIAGDQGLLLKSPDAINWTNTTVAGGRQLQGMAYGAGRYVAVAGEGTIITSTDATNWSNATSGTSADLTGIAYGNGKFFVPGIGTVLTSVDGLAWVSGPTPEIPNWESGTIFLNGRFYAGVGLNGLISSADGFTWAGHHLGFNYSEINGVAVFQGRTYLPGEFGMILSTGNAPAIVQPPTGQIITLGGPINLRVLAAGTPLPTTYQWRKGGVPIAGATSAIYGVMSATGADLGSYDVVISNSAGTITSTPVNVSLNAGVPPTITQQASFGLGTIVQAGSTVDYQFNVTGDAPVTVQFQRNGINLGAPVAPDAFNVAHLYRLNVTPADAGPYTGIANNPTGVPVTAVNNQAQFVVDGSNWRWRHPFPTALAINNVALNTDDGTTEFVALGNRGVIVTSPDGLVWDHAPSRSTNTVTGFVTGNGRHILFGGAWLAVDDGRYNFTPTSLGAFESITEIVFGQGVFVATCASGKIFSSPDGRIWTLRATMPGEGVFEAAFGNGTFVVSTLNGQLLRSTDGLTWTAPAAGPTANVWLLRHANSMFFLGSLTGELFSSPDAIAWTPLTSGVATKLSNMAHANGRYVIVGDSGVILTSDNGTTWTTRTTPNTINLTGVAFANNVWLAVGTNNTPGGNSLLRSADNGVTWINQFGTATTQQLNGIAANGITSAVAVGNGGGILRTTGVDAGWQPQSSGVGNLNDVTHTGVGYLAVGNGGVARTSVDDGITWLTSATGTANNLLWTGKLNGVVHAAGAAGTMLSFNGTAWSPVSTGTSAQINGAAYGLIGAADTYVAVGDAGTALTSANGTAWSAAVSGTAQPLNEVAFGNGTFVAVGAAGTIISSTNGNTWTNRSIPSFPENFTHVTFTQGHFIVAGSASGVFVSPDGVTWTPRYTGTSGGTGVRATAAFGEDIFGAGSGGAILTTTFVTYFEESPLSVNVPSGGSTTLRILTEGAVLPTTFQWRRGGIPIPGATGTSYTLTGAARADGGIYDVVSTNAAGTAISEPALVSVAPTQYPGLVAVDPTWDPNPITISTRTFAAIKLPSGKYIVGGESVRWDNQPRTALARLNADLTLDTSWTPPLINGIVYALAANSDGSIVYVGGDFTAIDGHLRPGLARLTGPNLAHDLTWRPLDPLPANVATQVSALAVQDNGQPLVARLSFVTGAIANTAMLRRLNLDGTHDASFSVDIGTANSFQRVSSIVVEPGATPAIAFAGTFTTVGGSGHNALARVSNTGVVDVNFGGVTGSNNGGTNNAVNFLSRLADGRYLVVGNFGQVGGLTRNRIALLSAADGSVDPTFVSAAGTFNGNVHAATMLSDGRILAVGNFTIYAGVNAAGIVRLNGTTGAVDSAFTVGAGAQASTFNLSGAGRNIHAFTLANDKVALVGTFNQLLGARRVATAIVDAAVSNADASNPSLTLMPVPSSIVHRPAFTGAAFLERDGSLTVMGSADIAGGTPGIGQLFRLRPDGSVDNTFPNGSGFGLNGLSTFGVFRAVRQGDGKYIAIGDFVTYNGVTANKLVRINPDGSHDPSFNAGTGPSTQIAQLTALSGGRLLLTGFGGGFTYNGVAVTGNIMRVNADGTRDATFNPGIGFPNGAAPNVVLEDPSFADLGSGGFLAAGPFSTYNGVAVPGIIRIGAGGGLDTSFNFGNAGPAGGVIMGFTLLGDGRLVIYGSFTTYNGVAVNRMAIIDPENGALDNTFVAPAAVDAQVNQVLVQEDGKFIAVGEFSTGPALRLTSAGGLDSSFALRGITGFPGGSGGARFIMADDGSLYVHNTLVSLDYGIPRSLVRFRGAAVAPFITQHPLGGTLTVGQPVVLSVRAGGTAPYTYQWRKNGTNIGGANDSVYAIPSATTGDAGSYDVVVTGAAGIVTSAAAALNDSATVTIVDQPASRRVVAGGTALFRVSGSSTIGGATLTYLWRKNGTAIGGATSADLTLSNVSNADAGSYSVVVGDGTGTVTSQSAVLTVLPADPVLWQQFTEFSNEPSPIRTVHDGAGKMYLPYSTDPRTPDFVGGRLAGALARLNESDGSLDPTFRLDRRFSRASHVAVQPDGKVVVAVAVGDTYTVIRVTTTGVIDSTFTAPFFARGVRFVTLQPDGKVLVAAVDLLQANPPAGALGADAPSVYRLNANGAVDSGFTRTVLGGNGFVPILFGPTVVDASGNIYLIGSFSTVNGTGRGNIARLNAAGVVDAAFAAALPAGFASPQARAVELQSDGRAVVVGDFRHTARGTTGNRIMAIRFNLDGSFDNTFAQPLQSELGITGGGTRKLRYLSIQPDDRIVVVTDRVLRLTANGALDGTFPNRTLGRESFWISRGADGRLFVPFQSGIFGQNVLHSTVGSGIAVITPTGLVDESFQTGGWGRSASSQDGLVLSDGRVWVAGQFNRFGATMVPGLAQFAANGTLSGTQAASARSMTAATVTDAGSDKVFAILGNGYNSTETAAATLVRLTPAGSLDGGFTPVLPVGYSLGSANIFASPGGRALLVQESVDPRDALAGTTGNTLIRLNSDGTRDAGYNPVFSSFAVVERDGASAITMIRTGGTGIGQVLADGRAIIGVLGLNGSFSLKRLLDNGVDDATFVAPSFGTITPTVGFTDIITDPVTGTTAQFDLTTYDSDLVRAAHQVASGKVYVGGRFALGGAPVGLARLNTNGSLDATFTGTGIGSSRPESAPYVTSIVSDAFGRVYVGGRFDSFNGTPVPAGIFRLRADGAFDAAWVSPISVYDAPYSEVRLQVVGNRLYAFGTVALAGDTLPAPYRFADIPPPPSITTAPVAASVAVGGSATFTVVAGGTGPFTYQWLKNGTPIGGATADSFTINLVSAPDAGNYSVAISDVGGTTETTPVALSILTAPTITTQPLGQAVSTGANLSLTVVAAGSPPLTYQWKKGAADIVGATAATYSIPSVVLGDAGNYSVVVSNTAGNVTSNVVTVSVLPAGFSATHAVVGAGYTAGSTVTITNTVNYTGTLSTLGWHVLLPDGWSFASTTSGDVPPNPGDTSVLDWAWFVTIPTSPFTFTYTLNVPAGATGTQQIVALMLPRQNNTQYSLVATPDPLLVNRVTFHTADINGDGRLGLTELLRVIELYNTRNGTVRTGAYAVDAGNLEDGFTTDPARASAAVVTLSRYHAADVNQDGKLALTELLRVIELYNYRAGTVRTGEYRLQGGTEDGFAPGP